MRLSVDRTDTKVPGIRLHQSTNISPSFQRSCFPEAMSRERRVLSEFTEDTQNFWATNGDYDEVNALLIHWAEDDLQVVPEIEKLRQLLQLNLNFNAITHSIPNFQPDIDLQHKLTKFVRQYSIKKRSLAIVYYAGHADNVDKSSPTGYSEWRALSLGISSYICSLLMHWAGRKMGARPLIGLESTMYCIRLTATSSSSWIVAMLRCDHMAPKRGRWKY